MDNNSSQGIIHSKLHHKIRKRLFLSNIKVYALKKFKGLKIKQLWMVLRQKQQGNCGQQCGTVNISRKLSVVAKSYRYSPSFFSGT